MNQKKYKEIIIHPLKDQFIVNWYDQSKLIKAEIPSLTKDFTYLLSEFIKMYSKFLESDDISDQIKLLIEYCEKMNRYLKRRLHNNFILTIKDGKPIIQRIYKEKKGKIYPEIVSVPIYNIQTEAVKDMFFVPYLIYDDLLDVFFYNTQLLSEKTRNVNLKRFQENGIINKRSRTSNVKLEKVLARVEIERFL